MGTRCNIVLKCGDQRKYIYRHYDGSPCYVKYELEQYREAIRWYADNYTTFCQELAGGKAKAGADKVLNDPQFLLDFYADILVKHEAWDTAMTTLLAVPLVRDAHTHYEPMQLEGKYEITNGIHGDIDWLYNVVIDEKTHKVRSFGYSPVRGEDHNPYAMLEAS